jgi:hypothetical protein
MGAFQSLIQLASAIWLTMGQSRLVMYWGVTSNLAVLVVFVGGAYIGRSAEAVAFAYMIYSVCLLTPLCLYYTRSWCKIPLKGLGTGLLRILPDVAIMCLAVWGISTVMIRAGLPAPIILAGQTIVGAVTYLACFRFGSAAELGIILAALPGKIKNPMMRVLMMPQIESAS